MAEKFTVQMGDEYYRLVGPDGEEGAMVPLGQTAVLTIDDAVYYTDADEPDDDPDVYRVDSVSAMPSEVEDVVFPEAVLSAQKALDAVLAKQESAVIEVESGPEA